MHYRRAFPAEFGGDAFLTDWDSTALVQWRGLALMKSQFDFALHPLLLAELRPQPVFEIGSGFGASACWLVDPSAMLELDVDPQFHSIDINHL